MRLIILSALILFLSITEGLECYSCADFSSDHVCTVPTTENCTDSPNINYSKQFCATISYSKHEVAENCSGDCIAKGCLPLFFEGKCKTSETFELPFGNISCCQGDLCSSSVKISDQNDFLCAIFLLISLFILFFDK